MKLLLVLLAVSVLSYRLESAPLKDLLDKIEVDQLYEDLLYTLGKEEIYITDQITNVSF